MTESRRSWLLPALGLGLVIVGALAWLGRGEAEQATRTSDSTFATWNGSLSSVAQLGRGDTIPKLRVDPASPNFEGGEDDDWDALGREGRIARTEQVIAELEDRIHDADDPHESARLHRQALDALAVARSDYYTDDDGRARHRELETALEQGE